MADVAVDTLTLCPVYHVSLTCLLRLGPFSPLEDLPSGYSAHGAALMWLERASGSGGPLPDLSG